MKKIKTLLAFLTASVALSLLALPSNGSILFILSPGTEIEFLNVKKQPGVNKMKSGNILRQVSSYYDPLSANVGGRVKIKCAFKVKKAGKLVRYEFENNVFVPAPKSAKSKKPVMKKLPAKLLSLRCNGEDVINDPIVNNRYRAMEVPNSGATLEAGKTCNIEAELEYTPDIRARASLLFFTDGADDISFPSFKQQPNKYKTEDSCLRQVGVLFPPDVPRKGGSITQTVKVKAEKNITLKTLAFETQQLRDSRFERRYVPCKLLELKVNGKALIEKPLDNRKNSMKFEIAELLLEAGKEYDFTYKISIAPQEQFCGSLLFFFNPEDEVEFSGVRAGKMLIGDKVKSQLRQLSKPYNKQRILSGKGDRLKFDFTFTAKKAGKLQKISFENQYVCLYLRRYCRGKVLSLTIDGDEMVRETVLSKDRGSSSLGIRSMDLEAGKTYSVTCEMTFDKGKR